MAKSKKIDVEVVSVEKGVLTVITEDGCLEEYLQRGVRENLTSEQRAVAVHIGILVPHWNELPKIPRNWNLRYYAGLVDHVSKAFQFPKNLKIVSRDELKEVVKNQDEVVDDVVESVDETASTVEKPAE